MLEKLAKDITELSMQKLATKWERGWAKARQMMGKSAPTVAEFNAVSDRLNTTNARGLIPTVGAKELLQEKELYATPLGKVMRFIQNAGESLHNKALKLMGVSPELERFGYASIPGPSYLDWAHRKSTVDAFNNAMFNKGNSVRELPQYWKKGDGSRPLSEVRNTQSSMQRLINSQPEKTKRGRLISRISESLRGNMRTPDMAANDFIQGLGSDSKILRAGDNISKNKNLFWTGTPEVSLGYAKGKHAPYVYTADAPTEREMTEMGTYFSPHLAEIGERRDRLKRIHDYAVFEPIKKLLRAGGNSEWAADPRYEIVIPEVSGLKNIKKYFVKHQGHPLLDGPTKTLDGIRLAEIPRAGTNMQRLRRENAKLNEELKRQFNLTDDDLNALSEPYSVLSPSVRNYSTTDFLKRRAVY